MTSSISNHVGLPLYVRRCTPSEEWAKGSEAYANPNADLLHLSCDPETGKSCLVHASDFGKVNFPAEWEGEAGSLIVVRADPKPLLPLHVEALCKYIEDDIQPLMERASGKYDEKSPLHVSKQAVVSMVSAGSFGLFWHRFVEEKCNKGEFDSAVPSPFEIEDEK